MAIGILLENTIHCHVGRHGRWTCRDFRRNLIVRGVDLGSRLEQRFRYQGVKFEGCRGCPALLLDGPGHLEQRGFGVRWEAPAPHRCGWGKCETSFT